MAIRVKEDFYSKLIKCTQDEDRVVLDDIILNEVAKVCKDRKSDLIQLMNGVGVKCCKDASTSSVVNKVVKNIGENKRVRLGTSVIIADNNKLFKPKQIRDPKSRVQMSDMKQKQGDKKFWGAVRLITDQVCKTWGIPPDTKEKKYSAEGGGTKSTREKIKELTKRVRDKLGLKRDNKKLIIIGVSVLVVAGIIGLVYWKMKNRGGVEAIPGNPAPAPVPAPAPAPAPAPVEVNPVPTPAPAPVV